MGTNTIGTINPTTDVISEFSVPTSIGGGESITAGPDGNLWFTASGNPYIGEINPTTDAFAEFTIPNGDSARFITAGPDGNLWFTDINNNTAVGAAYYTKLDVTQQPSASVTAGSPFGLTAEDVDSSGNLVTSFNGTVTVAIGRTAHRLRYGDQWVAIFSGITITQASSWNLSISAAGTGGARTSITVTPAVASQIVVTQQPPATVKVNTGFGLAAAIEDQYGNVVRTASNTVNVAFASNPTGATLGGTRSVSPTRGW